MEIDVFKYQYHECQWSIEKINYYDKLAECDFCFGKNKIKQPINSCISLIFTPFRSEIEREIEICFQCFHYVDLRLSQAVVLYILYIEQMLLSKDLTCNPFDQEFYKYFLQYNSWTYFFSIKTDGPYRFDRHRSERPDGLLIEDLLNINYQILESIYVDRDWKLKDFNLKKCQCGRFYNLILNGNLYCKQCSYYGYNGCQIMMTTSCEIECDICCEKGEKFMFGCKHNICINCLKNMKSQTIKNEKINDSHRDIFVKCPFCRDPYLLLSNRSIDLFWEKNKKIKDELKLYFAKKQSFFTV